MRSPHRGLADEDHHPANNTRGSSPTIYKPALERAKTSRDTSKWLAKPHRHSFQPIGSHTLHAGYKPKGVNPYNDMEAAIREVRKVLVCRFCPELRVKISRHLVLGLRGEMPKNTADKRKP